MAWGMNLSGMPAIRSFAQAQAHWTKAEPWRNKHASWRPLQNRRKHHVRLVQLHDEEGYECVLYNTPMVTYYANDDVKVVGHDSVASYDFAWRVTPTGITPASSNARMHWQVDTPGGTRYYRDDTHLLLTPAPTHGWQLLNDPIRETEEVLDRKKAAAVRKLLSHYDKWEKMTARLVGEPGQIGRYQGSSHSSVCLLLNQPEDPETFSQVRDVIGPVACFRETAYKLMGAYDEVAVPHDRLPRKRK